MRSRLLPYLALALVLAEVALVLVSWLLSATMTDGVRSLLSNEGLRWAFANFADWLASPLLVWMLLLAMAWGALHKSGLVRALTVQPAVSAYRHRLALQVVAVLFVLCVAVVLALTLMPHALLLSATGHLWPSPFSRALVPILAFGVLLLSAAYGVLVGTIRTLADFFSSLSFGISQAAPLFVVYVLLIQFYESLRFVFL